MDDNIECLIGRQVEEDALIGRGWWPIKDGKINRRKRPLKGIKTLSGLEMPYAKFTLNDRDGDMAKYNWAKSIPFYEDDCDVTTFLIFALRVEDGKIVDVGEFEKDCHDPRYVCFGCLMDLPDDGNDEEMQYDMYSLFVDNYQAYRMISEVKKVIAGRFIGKNHELVGKKLPASYSANTGFSTVRNCYWGLYPHLNDDNVIQAFSFYTYVSNGSADANMFSRPRPAPDHVEDVIYGILRIVDCYTDEEWEQM